MARFTFAAGNARGLRRLPSYALGGLATLVVPRTRAVWVFGSGTGPGEGALPLYRAARKRLPQTVRLVWLGSDPTEVARAQGLGLDSVLKLSVHGLWLTLRAEVAVVTHGLGDVNRYGVRGSLVVQLWHGIPLKRLHLDAPVALSASSWWRREVIRRGYRAVGRQIGVFPVSSALVAPRVTTAFGLSPGTVVVTGDPRDDVLLSGDPTARRTAAKTQLQEAVGTLPAGPVILYAPTWRDGDPDPGAPDEREWGAIARCLDSIDGALIVRTHPLGSGDYTAGPARSPRVRLLDAQAVSDLTPVLPAFDVLVTDYSSAALDFVLTGGTVVFLAVDTASYLSSRGLYEPYGDITGGQHAVTWADALGRLMALVEGGEQAATLRAHSAWLRQRYFDHLDGRGTERVLAHVLYRTGRGAAPGTSGIRRPMVTAVELTDDRVEIVIDPGAAAVTGVALVGARDQVVAVQKPGDKRDVRWVLPLLVERWGSPGLALPSGDYRLVLDGVGGGGDRLEVGPSVEASRLCPLFRVRAVAAAGGLVLRIAAPLTDDEVLDARRRRFRLSDLRPRRLEEAVFFESFYGRSASDNPAGIDRALARLRPEVTRYWSVTDRSVAVPPGGVPVVEYSRQWWQVRASARIYVLNDWLRWSFRKRIGQHVLQTWHGSMLKRLALDRPGRTPRQDFAAVRQALRWSAVLAQNEHSASILRSAYAFRGPVWVTGYPRNDVLVDPTRAAVVRGLLGVAPTTRLVLYAPTWREDREEMVDHVDLVAFTARLPAHHVLLVRGHSRTLAHGRELRADKLLDVTRYPDVVDLLLVADVLITDYSSLMFDFSATGKPMVFHAPDRDHYGEVLRGFYFNLLEQAPGPVVETEDELLEAVLRAEDTRADHAGRYAAWQARFTPYEDGSAGERTVRHMIERGWFG